LTLFFLMTDLCRTNKQSNSNRLRKSNNLSTRRTW